MRGCQLDERGGPFVGPNGLPHFGWSGYGRAENLNPRTETAGQTLGDPPRTTQ
jgi:hypothetical protein